METKSEYLLDSSNTLNLFEIQKNWNKIFLKDGYWYSKKILLSNGPNLHCSIRDYMFLGLFLP